VPIRVVLIEDNDVFRGALELLLGQRGDIEIVAAEPSGERAVELCRRGAADVLVVDYRLPGDDGVQVARRVRAECPDVAVVVLSAAAGERELEALREAGAVACVGKDEPLDAIVLAVQQAAGIGAG
jgi:DNA-binding NarL/FixJ family response regulator